MADVDPFKDEGADVESLKQKVDDLESQLGSLNPRNFAGISSKELSSATIANLFGDGSDGDVILDGSTDYNNFSSRSSAIYTLTRDVFANEMTINNGSTLITDGYRVFVKDDLINRGTISSTGNDGTVGGTNTNSGTFEQGGGGGGSGSPGGIMQLYSFRIINEGTIDVSGGAGGAGGAGNATGQNTGDSAGGAGGAIAHSSGSLPATIAGVSGGKGAGQTTQAVGVTGTSISPGVGAAGAGGGGGGGGGSSGGTGGSVTSAKNLPHSPMASYLWYDTLTADPIGGSAVGGGGGGGNTSTSAAGGGGGGAGGSGGVLIRVYGSLSGAGTTTLAGGAGGAGGAGDNATDGADGGTGNTGITIDIPVA